MTAEQAAELITIMKSLDGWMWWVCLLLFLKLFS